MYTLELNGQKYELEPFKDGNYFAVRELMGGYQVCTKDLIHIAQCDKWETARLVADALNIVAGLEKMSGS